MHAPRILERAEDFEDQEKEIENAAAAERERRKEHGMDFDKVGAVSCCFWAGFVGGCCTGADRMSES